MSENLAVVKTEVLTHIRKAAEKAISRKLLVWATATHMTYIHLLDPEYWFTISLIFMGIQGALDWKNNVPTSNQRPPPETDK